MMKVDISGKHMELSEDIQKYTFKKIGRLDRYIPRHARRTAYAQIVLRTEAGKQADRFLCDAVIHLPRDQITAKEATINIFAAVDIVEAKLKNQLLRYKNRRTEHRSKHEIVRRIRERLALNQSIPQDEP